MTKNNDAFTPDASKPASENAVNGARHGFVSRGLENAFADLWAVEKRGNLPDLNQRIETTRRAISAEKAGSVRAIQSEQHLLFLSGLHDAASADLTAEFMKLLRKHAPEILNDIRRLAGRFDDETSRIMKVLQAVYTNEGWAVPDSISEHEAVLALKRWPAQHLNQWLGTFDALSQGTNVSSQLSDVSWPLCASGWVAAYEAFKTKQATTA